MDHHLTPSSSHPISKKPRSSGSRRPRSTAPSPLTAPPHRKELYLNALPINNNSSKKRSGSLAPAGGPGPGEGGKLRKVKLKVGGVTRTIHAKAGTEAERERQPHKSEHWFTGTAQDSTAKYRTDSPPEPTRKSRRVPKRRSIDDDLDQDHETKYLEKMRGSKHATHSAAEFDGYPPDRKRKLSKINNINNGNNGGNNGGGGGSRSNLGYEMDEDFVGGKSNRRRGSSREVDLVNEEEMMEVDLVNEGKHLTSRQRAMQGKGGNNGENLVEYPNGLPPAPSRKKNDKLSEVEIQAKKAEAAQRRKMQVEKAAKEAEAEAIRKILGLDSDKKKEEKKQKEREDKENKAKSQTMASNVVKLVMGPTGIVVTFPDELGLPSIFNSKPSNYPPPREKCAGPSCKNPYKYRDSKSKLPLCSLQCYKAVQGSANALTC